MTITPTVPGAGGAALPAQAPRQALLTSDFETFLRMLTVQIRNQDPLNPMQSTEFATQLATFASVEQQVRANTQLEGLSQKMGLSALAQLSGWIGMQARTDAPVRLAGTSVTVWPSVPGGSDSAELVVRDRRGTEVQRLPIGLTGEPLDWAGVQPDGTVLPPGTYRLAVEAVAGGTRRDPVPVQHYATVREARSDGAGGIELVLDGDVTVPAASVTALRRAGGF